MARSPFSSGRNHACAWRIEVLEQAGCLGTKNQLTDGLNEGKLRVAFTRDCCVQTNVYRGYRGETAVKVLDDLSERLAFNTRSGMIECESLTRKKSPKKQGIKE